MALQNGPNRQNTLIRSSKYLSVIFYFISAARQTTIDSSPDVSKWFCPRPCSAVRLLVVGFSQVDPAI